MTVGDPMMWLLIVVAAIAALRAIGRLAETQCTLAEAPIGQTTSAEPGADRAVVANPAGGCGWARAMSPPAGCDSVCPVTAGRRLHLGADQPAYSFTR